VKISHGAEFGKWELVQYRGTILIGADN